MYCFVFLCLLKNRYGQIDAALAKAPLKQLTDRAGHYYCSEFIIIGLLVIVSSIAWYGKQVSSRSKRMKAAAP